MKAPWTALGAFLLAALLPAAGVGAQEVSTDDVFSGDLVVGIEAGERDQSATLLKSETVEIGGTFRFEADSSWTWDGLEGPLGASLVDDPLAVDLGVRLFLDARPEETFRVFGKVNVSYPFSDQEATRSFDEVFHVVELFSDFQVADALFFRAGKQTIHWGVGTFFSPSDLLNVTEIDPEDPSAELEGPVALKVQAPVGPHNLYLYVVLEDAQDPYDLAVAPKVELVIGNSEIGVGAYYRSGDAPAAMTTLTTSWGDFDLFGEAVLSYGSNRTWVVEDPAAPPPGLGTRTYGERLYPSGTAGLRYRYADDRSWFDTTVSAQYLYNGDGYEDVDFVAEHWSGIQALVGSGSLSQTDLVYAGRHYGAVSAAWTEMLDSDLTLSSLWIANLADGSGMIAPSIRWAVGDNLKLSLKVSWMYGDAGADYTRGGERSTVSLKAEMGGGSF